jgi:hypothetical protein
MGGTAPRLFMLKSEPIREGKIEEVKPNTVSGTVTKLFRRESGQIQAVTEEAKQILEVTKAFIDRVKSDPPPPPAIRNRLPPGAGLYKGVPTPTERLLEKKP